MICSRCFLHDMKNAVPAFRFRFSRIDDALILLVESCRNVDGCVSLVLIALYTAVVSAENNLAFVTTSVCRRTIKLHFAGSSSFSGPEGTVVRKEPSLPDHSRLQ